LEAENILPLVEGVWSLENYLAEPVFCSLESPECNEKEHHLGQ